MKTLTKLSVAAFAIVAAASCSKEIQTIESQIPSTGIAKVPVTFTATLDDATKGFISGQTPTWEVGDSLVIYDNIAIATASSGKTAGTVVKPAIDTFRVAKVSGNAITIYGNISEGATSFVAAYPFSAAAGIVVGTDSVAVTVPNNQIIPQGKNIDPKALVSVAKSTDGTFAFKNVVSLVKFNISKTNVSCVILKGKEGELFVGTERVLSTSGAAGQISFATKASLAISSEAEVFTAGDFYAAVIPSSMPSGLQIACTAGENTYTKTSANAASFKRNGGLNFGTVDNGAVLVSEIKTLADFKAFADAIGLYGPASVVKVSADIDFGGPATKWATPADAFQGTLDGQNHRIYNFVAETDNEVANTGLINTLGLGIENDPACVKNLCVGSKDYDFSTKTGNYDGVSKISFSAVNSAYKYPGIIPYAHNYSIVKNVVNFMPITVEAAANTSHRAAGVCGTIKAYVTVTDCINFGDITDNMTTGPKVGSSIGGVVGAIDGAGSLVKNCVNYGVITTQSPFVTYIGGVAGPITGASSMENCVNNGTVAYSAVHTSTGTTNGYANRAGGITSSTTADGVKIVKCTNNGEVYIDKQWGKTTKQTNPGLGGIIGVASKSVSIMGCTNTGVIGPKNMDPNTTGAFGGLVGYTTGTTTVLKITKAEDGTINKCSGTIGFEGDTKTGTLYIGGIVGYHNGDQTTSVVEDCEFTGTISIKGQKTAAANFGIGGIAGLSVPATFRNCKVSGNITIDGAAAGYIAGGLIGGSNTPKLVENSEVTGTITLNSGKATTTRVGGLLSIFKPEVTVFRNNKFTGSIVDTDATNLHLIGGLAGAVVLNSTTTAITNAENCTIAGTISYAKTDKEGAVFGDLLGAAADKVKGNTTFGTAEKPLYVGGSLNGTALPATGYETYMYGTYADNATMMDSGKVVFNTVNINK